MKLRQTWRWFGPDDPVSLSDIRQAGVQGIVTALHHVPHGDVWTREEITKRQHELAAHGYQWDVVESVTIHEDIKTRSGDYRKFIDQYKASLRNLSEAGISIVTYNFMPVNDWTRTSIDYTMPDGSKALYFNWSDLAVFDIYVLKREEAESSYDESILRDAKTKYKSMSKAHIDRLTEVIVFGIPGEKKKSIAEMQELIGRYKDIDREGLRENLKYFLQEISPLAEELGIRLAIHPDDPPFDILGLPRIVSTESDYDYILSAVPAKNNGVCFCTGSLGANKDNNLPRMVRKFGDRIHFVHLRNVRKDEQGNFFEDDHLGGDTDMYAVMKELLTIQQSGPEPIPFRPDHGHQMLDDLHKTTNPGYSAIGRLRGLAELRGLELGIMRSEGWN